MFYVYWDDELVSACRTVAELSRELVDANITGSDLFEFLFYLGKRNSRVDESTVQMSDGSKHRIMIQVYYAEDHNPYVFSQELPF